MQTARRGRGRGRIAAVEWRGSSPAFAKLAAKHNWGTASNNDASGAVSSSAAKYSSNDGARN